MRRPQPIPVWIAALAVVLHLFAMPLMAGHMPSGAPEHCPMSAANPHHVGQGTDHHLHASDEQAPQPSHHTSMPCCCATGTGSLAAIAVGSPTFLEPRLVPLGTLSLATPPPLTPRYRWPSLNPRASPLA